MLQSLRPYQVRLKNCRMFMIELLNYSVGLVYNVYEVGRLECQAK